MRFFRSDKNPQEPNPQHLGPGLLRSLVTKNAWVTEFHHLISKNSISWIFGLVFDEWKPHHWNPQNPRTDPWNFHEKYWELGELKISVFFSFFPKTGVKQTSKSLWWPHCEVLCFGWRKDSGKRQRHAFWHKLHDLHSMAARLSWGFD